MNNKKYDTVKVNGFKALEVLPRPTARPNPIKITKNTYEDGFKFSSRTSGARRLEAVPNLQPSPSRLFVGDDNYESRPPFLNNINSRIKNNVVGEISNFEYEDSYELPTNEFVYNDFYV